MKQNKKHYWLFSLAFLLNGCSTVSTHEEWHKLKEHTNNQDELIWVQNERDERIVCELTESELEKGLDECSVIRLAMMRNQELQTALEDIGIAKSDLIQAGLLKNPSISSLFRFPSSGSGFLAESSSMIPISELWQLPYRKKKAKAHLEKTLLNIAQSANQTRRDARKSYCEATFYLDSLQDMEALLDINEKLYKESLLRHEWGYTTPDENLRDQIILNDTRVMHENHILMSQISMNLLGKILNLTSEKINLKCAKLNEPTQEDFDSSKYLQKAFNCRLDLRALKILVKEKKYSLELQKKRLFKEVHTGVSYEHEFEGKNSLGPALEMELPIFDQNQAQIARASYELRKAKKQLSTLENDIRQEVTDNIKTIEYLSKKINTLKTETIPQQEELNKFYTHWNSLMQVNSYKKLEAEKDLISRRVEYKKTLMEYQNAIIELEYSTGF